MARNILQLDTSGFEKMIAKLDSVGGNVKQAVADALEQASETISEDTKSAVQKANLPAGGKYSQGDTEMAIINDARMHWDGSAGWVPVGFDFSKVGAGGFLITGTPRMAPDYELRKMYRQKGYIKQIQQDISDVILDYVVKAMER